MAIAINTAKARLKRNQLAIGIGVRLVRNVDIIKVMKAAGFDWLFLDLEHGTMSIDAAAQIATAALDAGIAPLARVPNGEYAIATRLLDNGVMGIVMPHVDTADEAREVVQKLKYPLVGHRSMGGTGPHYGLRSASTGDAARALNAANLTVVMLERRPRLITPILSPRCPVSMCC
jgi:4-hydroxy-2-oxoheptanedioate aldolase